MHTEDRPEGQALLDEPPIADTGYDREGYGHWGRVFAAGTAVIAGLATVLSRAEPAYADCQHSPCCTLASCRVCQVNGKPYGWNCPRGYFRTGWNCVWGGTHHALCGECSRGTDCYSGPWYCSIWFGVN